MPNRPHVIVNHVNIYNKIVYWHYHGENFINESSSDYFLKTFEKLDY